MILAQNFKGFSGRSFRVIRKFVHPRLTGCHLCPASSRIQLPRNHELTALHGHASFDERAADPLHRAGIDAELLGDFANTRATRLVKRLMDSHFEFRGNRRPAKPFALALGPRKPSADSFLDYAALELGKDAHHLEHRLAGRRRGVETLLVQEQVDPESMQFGQEAQQGLAGCGRADRPTMPSPHRTAVWWHLGKGR